MCAIVAEDFSTDTPKKTRSLHSNIPDLHNVLTITRLATAPHPRSACGGAFFATFLLQKSRVRAQITVDKNTIIEMRRTEKPKRDKYMQHLRGEVIPPTAYPPNCYPNPMTRPKRPAVPQSPEKFQTRPHVRRSGDVERRPADCQTRNDYREYDGARKPVTIGKP